VRKIGKIFLSTSISQGFPAVRHSGTDGEYRKNPYLLLNSVLHKGG